MSEKQPIRPEWQPYIDAWRQRLAAEREQLRDRERAALAASRRCAQLLVGRFAARRVYLFGSLTGQTSAPFGFDSDVDLAVEGLTFESEPAALEALEAEMPPGLPLDLIHVETATPSTLRRIRARGELLRHTAIRGAEIVRGFHDAALARSAPWPCLGPEPISVDALVEQITIGHVEGHMASIRDAIGAVAAPAR